MHLFLDFLTMTEEERIGLMVTLGLLLAISSIAVLLELRERKKQSNKDDPREEPAEDRRKGMNHK
jgi:hypothetical protein